MEIGQFTTKKLRFHCLPKIELSEVEMDSLMFNVPLFIFLNEIQGKTFVKKNTSVFIRML